MGNRGPSPTNSTRSSSTSAWIPSRAPCPACSNWGVCARWGPCLGLNTSGRQQAHLKTAFHQNASAYIVAKLRYRSRDGTERRLEAGFTRYSVLFTGEPLPDGTPADAIYLVLSEPYLGGAQPCAGAAPGLHLPQGPPPDGPALLRDRQLQNLRGTTQHRAPCATLRYADYCLLATQHARHWS